VETPRQPPEPPYDTSEPIGLEGFGQGGSEADEPKKERARPILAVIGVVVVIVVKLGLLGFVLPGLFHNGSSSDETGEHGYWHLFFPSGRTTLMTLGAPVIADGQRIGEIVAVNAYEGNVAIGFHITPSYNSIVQSEPGFAVGPIGNRHLCFGTKTECGRGSPAPPTTQLDPPAEAATQ
jgi:hypothetical protein